MQHESVLADARLTTGHCMKCTLCKSVGPCARHAYMQAMLPSLSWLEREAVNLKVGSSNLPGSRRLGAACPDGNDPIHHVRVRQRLAPAMRLHKHSSKNMSTMSQGLQRNIGHTCRHPTRGWGRLKSGKRACLGLASGSKKEEHIEEVEVDIGCGRSSTRRS